MKIFYIILLMQTSIFANILLEKPKTVSAAQMEQLSANWQTCFQWNFGNGCSFICTYQEGTAGFLLQALWLPIRSCNFPYYKAVKQLLSTRPEYYFQQPLILKNQTPLALTADELCQLLHYKNVVFYTGAGLSAASDVATMNSLEQSLQLTQGITAFLKKCFFNPTAITKAFDTFCRSAIEASATPAHYALHQLAHYKECCILTENVDLLQQRTDSCPLFTHSDEAHKITPEDLKAIDILICVGLSQDDCGFIAHYKKNNPQGTLVALNKNIPNYLSSQDYLIQDDLQIVLPQIANCLSKE